MTDQYLASGLRAWLRDTEARPEDARRSTDKVMARVEQAGQRGRWWPLGAFDRPVSTLPGREPAPAPIPVTNGRQPARGSTMFSAVKFMVASVIVALFSGFVLMGVLTTQQGDDMAPAAVTVPPSPTDELLSTMVTEEVEPGVYRVVDDGVRDLTSVEAVDIVAGYDGGIWLLREDGFLRLGSDGPHAWPADVWPVDDVLEVAPDGTMWVIPDERLGPALRSTDGEGWTVQPCPDGSTDCGGFTVAPDGTLWTSWEVGDRWRVSHLGPTGWQSLHKDTIGELRPLLPPTDAGDLYGVGADLNWYLDLWRYEDGVWQEQGSGLHNVDIAPDGTVWARVGAGVGDPALPDDQVGLARLVGGEWELWASADILPDIRIGGGSFANEFEVAPDGGLWVSLWRGITGYVCDGLARFDGVMLEHFLPGRCLLMDIAADGSVWVLAADDAVVVPEEGSFPDDQTWGLYVITPEAVAASE